MPAGNWDGSLKNVGNNGDFWSSVANSSDNAYNLNFNVDGNVNPSNYNNRDYGQSVRCVARPVSSTVTDADEGGEK